MVLMTVLGGRHGGAATAALLAQASLARRPPSDWSRLLFLRVWRRRLPPVRSSLRPPTRTLTPDPSGGKRAVIQNHCSFIGSDGGHSLSGPPRASRQNARGACPAAPQPGERALPATLARTSACKPRVPLTSAQAAAAGMGQDAARGGDVIGSQARGEARLGSCALADGSQARRVALAASGGASGACPGSSAGSEHRVWSSPPA